MGCQCKGRTSPTGYNYFTHHEAVHKTELPKPDRQWNELMLETSVSMYLYCSAPVKILGHASRTLVFGQVKHKVESSNDWAKDNQSEKALGSSGDGACKTTYSSNGSTTSCSINSDRVKEVWVTGESQCVKTSDQ